jgi:hypothetical protein
VSLQIRMMQGEAFADAYNLGKKSLPLRQL